MVKLQFVQNANFILLFSAKLPFIYYATFSPLSDHEQHINNLGETLVDVEDISARIQLGYIFFNFIFNVF